MTTASCSKDTSSHDSKQDALRRSDDRIARLFAAQVDNAEEGAALRSYAASRGIIPSTLARWSIGYMPAAHDRRSMEALAALGIEGRDLAESGLLALRFASCIVIPVLDQNGGIYAWLGQPVNTTKPSGEDSGDRGEHECVAGQMRDGDLLRVRTSFSRAARGSHQEEAYPLVFSPRYLELSSGVDMDTPIIVCADVVDAILVDQAGVAAIGLVDAVACPKQLDFLTRLLAPHANAHRPLFACFNTRQHRDKRTEASLADRRMARFLAGMWERNKHLARSIRVLGLPATGDSKVDLGGVLADDHDAEAADAEVIKAQRTRLEELAASSSESIEYMTDLQSGATHEPDFWRETAPRVGKAVDIGPEPRAKRVVKRTAENAASKGRDKRLARYTTKSGTIRATYAAVYILLNQHSGRRLVFDTMTLTTSEMLNPDRPWELSALDDERMSDLQLELADLRCDARRQTVEHAASAISLKNRLNPVECYLRALPRPSGEHDLVPYVSSKILGLTEANGYTAEQIDLHFGVDGLRLPRIVARLARLRQ